MPIHSQPGEQRLAVKKGSDHCGSDIGSALDGKVPNCRRQADNRLSLASLPGYGERLSQLSRVPSERVNFLYPYIAKDHRGFVRIERKVDDSEQTGLSNSVEARHDFDPLIAYSH
jgi:hypothetical protein